MWIAEKKAGGEMIGHCGLRFLERAGAAARFGFEEAGLDRIVAEDVGRYRLIGTEERSLRPPDREASS